MRVSTFVSESVMDLTDLTWILYFLFYLHLTRNGRIDMMSPFPFSLPDRLWKYVVHILFTFGKLMESKSDR